MTRGGIQREGGGVNSGLLRCDSKQKFIKSRTMPNVVIVAVAVVVVVTNQTKRNKTNRPFSEATLF